MGLVMTMIVGILGAYVGTAIATNLGKQAAGQAPGWVWSVVGAMVVLVLIVTPISNGITI